MLERNVSVQSTKQILCSHSVSGLIVDNGDIFIGRALEEGFEDADFGDGIVWTTAMTTNAPGSSGSCEVDDSVAEEGDIGKEVGFLLCGELWICRIKGDVLVSGQDVDAEICGCGRHDDLRRRRFMVFVLSIVVVVMLRPKLLLCLFEEIEISRATKGESARCGCDVVGMQGADQSSLTRTIFSLKP